MLPLVSVPLPCDAVTVMVMVRDALLQVATVPVIQRVSLLVSYTVTELPTENVLPDTVSPGVVPLATMDSEAGAVTDACVPSDDSCTTDRAPADLLVPSALTGSEYTVVGL